MTEMNGAFKQTEIGPILVDWEVVTVGSVGQVVTGTTPPTKEPEYYGGPYMFISPGDIGGAKYVTRTQKHLSEAGLKVSRQLPRHTVLVVCIGATIGKTAMTVAEQSATNQQINAVIANEEVFADYLYYALTHRSPRLPDLAGRAAVPIVNKSNFAKFLIPIAPLPEQRRIARVLSTIQRAIAAQDDLIAAAREVKRSLMQRLFTYGPGPEPAPTKETEIGEIPEHWEVVRLEEIARIERGKFAHRPRNDPRFYGGTIPFIQTGDVANSGGRITSYSQTLNELGLSVSRVFPKGTIVITIAANIGYTGILRFDSAFPDSLIGITPTGSMDNIFLEYYLQTQQPKMDALAPRGTQKNINIQFLKPWPVLKPPLAEQREIAEMLSAIDRKIEAEEQRKAALQALFKTMLHQLMTGQLRLPKSER